MVDDDSDPVVPVFFLSDSTGISAETMGNALLIQFPDAKFERTTIPFISTVEHAREVVAMLDELMAGTVTPLVFTTAAEDGVREELNRTRAPLIDFFGMHMQRVESILGRSGRREAARLHGVGDIQRYNSRMAAVEFTIEHDDGQSLRAMDRADVILLAPSRCGKTPTSMYLALQHGLFVANYPLVDEDLERSDLPAPGGGVRRPVLGHHHQRRPAQPGAQRAPARLALRLARAVPVGAAPRQAALRGLPPARRRLLGQVGRGDQRADPAEPHLPSQGRRARPPHPGREPRMTEQTQPASTDQSEQHSNVRWFSDLGLDDIEQVGGKNASLGEMVSHLTDLGVRVPNGFATTAEAFHRFIGDTGLAERISGLLADLDTDDVRRLAEVGREIREAVVGQPFPEDLEADIRSAYDALVEESTSEGADAPSFAVRSSATAEDLPDASFAGQQETFLNVRGIDAVLQAVREVYASLYNDRAIAYRVHHDFAHDAVGISAGVQRMVRSDIGSSGVMFTMDTESGFTDAVFITSAFGLGEGVVQGAVNPDEFYVYKPALREGRPAVLKRSVGGKATKMVYTAGHRGRAHHRVRRRRAGPQPAAEPDRRRGHRAGPPRADHRGALRAPDGHRVGQGRRRRPPLRAPGAPRDRAVAPLGHARALRDGPGGLAGRRGAGRGPRDRAEDRRRGGAGAHRRSTRCTSSPRARCWSPT